MLADTGTQIVDSQINGAQPGKARGMLLKAFMRVAGAQGSRYSNAARGVQRSADDTAMQTAFTEVTDQLSPHGQADMRLRSRQGLQFQTHQFVEKDLFFKQVCQLVLQLNFKFKFKRD